MVKQIQLELKHIFSCKFICNGKTIESKNKKVHHFEIPELPAQCNIEIKPWKLKPLIRFDGQLVNYGLAKITPWDHMLEFTIPKDFLSFYFSNVLKSKKKYLQIESEKQFLEHIGLDTKNKKIVNEIKNQIK